MAHLPDKVSLLLSSMTAPGEPYAQNGGTRHTGAAVPVRRPYDPPGPPHPGHLRTRAPPLALLGDVRGYRHSVCHARDGRRTLTTGGLRKPPLRLSLIHISE